MELVDVWREGPITMYSSMGMNHYYNAHHAYFATTLLPVLTGNLGKPGAGYASMAGAVLGDMSVSRPEGTPGAPSFQVTTLMVDDIIAVSYTHLDVYKRQRLPHAACGVGFRFCPMLSYTLASVCVILRETESKGARCSGSW